MYSITEQNTSFSINSTKAGNLNSKRKLRTTTTSFLHFHSPLPQMSSSLFCDECGCLHFFNPTMFSTITSIKPYHLNYNVEILPLDYFISFKNNSSFNNTTKVSISDYLVNCRTRIIKKYKFSTNKLKLSFHTMYNALFILDKVLLSKKIYSNTKLDKFGLGALILSIKFNELTYNYQSLKYIQSTYEITNAILTSSQIKKIESLILKIINYDVINNSFITIINYFLLNGVLFNFDKVISNDSSKEDTSKSKQSLSMLTRKIAISIVEKNLQYIEYNQFYLACAVIAFARNQLNFEKWPQCVFEFIYKVKETDFEKEYSFVQTTYKVNVLNPSASNTDIILYKQISSNKGRNCKRIKPNNNNKLKSILSNNSVINSTMISPTKKKRFSILRSISKNEDTFRYPSTNSNITTNQSSVSTLRSCPKINRIVSQSQSIDIPNNNNNNNNQIIDLKSSSLSKYNNSNYNKQIILTDISDVSLYQRKKTNKSIKEEKNQIFCNTTANIQKDNKQQTKIECINTYKQKNKISFNLYNNQKSNSTSFVNTNSLIHKNINTSFNRSFINGEKYKKLANKSNTNNKNKMLNNSVDFNITLKNKEHGMISKSKKNMKNNHSMERKTLLNKKKVNVIEELILKKVLQCKQLTAAIEKTIINSFSKSKQIQNQNKTNANRSTVINKGNNNNKDILNKPTNCNLSSENVNLKCNISMKNISMKGLPNIPKYIKTKSIHRITKITKPQIKQIQ